MKGLIEKRNSKVKEMKTLLGLAKNEQRAFSDDENTKFETLEKEIKDLDGTIAAEARAKAAEIQNYDGPRNEDEEKRAESEERAFENHIRGIVEERADVNLATGDNGAIIPSSIANKIIKKVYDISPIYQLATRYNVGGTLNIPYYDEDTQKITMAYATEFADLESTSGKHTSISLAGFLAGALTKVSKSLINNTKFPLVDYVVKHMAEAIHRWMEKELLNGTVGKIIGLSTVSQKVTAAAQTAITADELIDLQELVPDAHQGPAIFIMNRSTRKAIRKLKDGDGTYLLQKDFNAKWGYTLLGKDVYASDNMPAMATSNTAIYYGDMSGLAVKISEEINIEVLKEKFATQHAYGVVGWVEADSKIEDAQKIAKLEMAGV